MITKFKRYKKKDFILLVGPPGSGKSTFIKKQQKNYDIINRDDITIEVTEKEGLTYKDAFNRPDYILGDDRKFFIPNEDDFYELKGKTYLRNYEKLGEIIDLPENSYLKRWHDKGFSKIIKINNIIEDKLYKKIEKSIKLKHNIIIDMTNMTKFLRKSVIDKLGKNKIYYTVKAIVFNKGGKGMENTLLNINKKRDLKLSKSNREKDISDNIITNMISKFEYPEKEEGIDKIIEIDTKKELETNLLREEYDFIVNRRYLYPIPNHKIEETINIFTKTNISSDFKLIRNKKIDKPFRSSDVKKNDYLIYFTYFKANYTDYNPQYFINKSHIMGRDETIEDYGDIVDDIDLELYYLKYNL